MLDEVNAIIRIRVRVISVAWNLDGLFLLIIVLNLDIYMRAVIHSVRMDRVIDIRSRFEEIDDWALKLFKGIDLIISVVINISDVIDVDHLYLFLRDLGSSRSRIKGIISFNIY